MTAATTSRCRHPRMSGELLERVRTHTRSRWGIFGTRGLQRARQGCFHEQQLSAGYEPRKSRGRPTQDVTSTVLLLLDNNNLSILTIAINEKTTSFVSSHLSRYYQYPWVHQSDLQIVPCKKITSKHVVDVFSLVER